MRLPAHGDQRNDPGRFVRGDVRRDWLYAIRDVTGLALPDGAGGGVITGSKSAFGIAPGRFLVIDQNEGLGIMLKAAVLAATGSITDLSHGRTAIRMSGPKSEWVLAKFFAIDFALAAFPEGAGRSTAHHDVFAQDQHGRAAIRPLRATAPLALVLDGAVIWRRGGVRGAVAATPCRRGWSVAAAPARSPAIRSGIPRPLANGGLGWDRRP